jgi:hypothetical protein
MAGESVVVEVAYLRIAEQLLPTGVSDSHATHLLAAKGRTGRGSGDLHSTVQKALTQMNLQLANVISDLSGVTGQKIVRAIVAGERDPRQLAKLRDARIQASQEVFVLKQEVDMYDTYQQRITECDQQLQKHLATFADQTNPVSLPRRKGNPRRRKKSLPKMLRRLISAASSSASREWI